MAVNSARLKGEFQRLRQDLEKHLAQANALLPPSERGLRQAQAQDSLLEFLRLYLPHWQGLPPGGLHHALDHTWAGLRQGGLGERLAIAAPRGNGKTTLLRALALDLLVRGKKRFVLWISGSLDQAKESLAALLLELAENPRLAQDFPGLTGQGPLWNAEEAILPNGAKLKAAGARKRLRGLNHAGQRPDLVIIDDLETEEEILNPELRQKAWDWLFSAILPLGPPQGGMDLIWVGTLLHPDSALARALSHPAFAGHRFAALQNWPERLDLWEEWENQLFTKGPEAALAFYQAHQAALEQGACCLWPEAQPLAWLMQRKALGKKSFFAEYQNQPMALEGQLFSGFHHYQALPSDLTLFGAIDPSLGGLGSDFSALVILGLAPTGRLYVVEAQLIRVKPHQLMERIFSLHQTWPCLRWAVEEVQFQAFFKEELARLSWERGVYLPLVGVRPKGPKRLRIEALEPLISSGALLFHPSQRLLLEQLENFPHARHDDGPDALEMAFQLARSQGVSGIKSQRPGTMEPHPRFIGY